MARTEHQKKLLAAYRERPITGAVCAVTDTVSGRTLLLASPNPAGQRNRFQFAVSTDMPLHPAMAADWRAHGGAAFTFARLEELEKKPGQTDRQFQEELELLRDIWRERLAAEGTEFYR